MKTSKEKRKAWFKKKRKEAEKLGYRIFKEKELRLEEIVGEGNFGRVYRAEFQGKTVAFKQIDPEKLIA